MRFFGRCALHSHKECVAVSVELLCMQMVAESTDKPFHAKQICNVRLFARCALHSHKECVAVSVELCKWLQTQQISIVACTNYLSFLYKHVINALDSY